MISKLDRNEQETYRVKGGNTRIRDRLQCNAYFN